MDLDLFKTISQFPFYHNDTFYDSDTLKQNKTCISRCKKKECITFLSKTCSVSEYQCPKGYDNILINLRDNFYILNGLIYKTNRAISREGKEARTDYIIDRDDLFNQLKKYELIDSSVHQKINEAIEKNLTMFHDFKTSMSIFFSCTEDIISKLPGDSFNKKLENSDKSYKDLYNALVLITSQLRMIDVIINPESIEFGKKKQINIYRLFEKMKILFEHLSSKRKELQINLIPETWVHDSYCYESIEFIPLILLDNAIKYSVSDSAINIKFEQAGYNKIKVLIKNIGPLVNDTNMDKIFEKFFRDEYAKTFSKEGMGMGLWIAQQILKAHNSKLCYYKDPNETNLIGLNVFEFELETIPQ